MSGLSRQIGCSNESMYSVCLSCIYSIMKRMKELVRTPSCPFSLPDPTWCRCSNNVHGGITDIQSLVTKKTLVDRQNREDGEIDYG